MFSLFCTALRKLCPEADRKEEFMGRALAAQDSSMNVEKVCEALQMSEASWGRAVERADILSTLLSYRKAGEKTSQDLLLELQRKLPDATISITASVAPPPRMGQKRKAERLGSND